MLLDTVTGPVARFARQIAGQGYICAAPSSYHEFTGPEPLKYDAEDTDKGNAWKIGKVSYSARHVIIPFEFLHELVVVVLYIPHPLGNTQYFATPLTRATRTSLHIDKHELLTSHSTMQTETVCLRRRRQSIGRLSPLTADMQWPRWRDGNVSRWPFGVSLCLG